MKKRVMSNSMKIYTVSLFAILLLCAPCSVRNYLQLTFGIHLTKSLSPNKSTNFQSSNQCSLLIHSGQKNKNAKNQVQVAYLPNSHFKTLTPKISYVYSYVNFDNSIQLIPYYILYKRLKTYSLS